MSIKGQVVGGLTLRQRFLSSACCPSFFCYKSLKVKGGLGSLVGSSEFNGGGVPHSNGGHYEGIGSRLSPAIASAV